MCNFCKILIVDDELIMRKGIRHIIDWEQEGFEIIGEASNGQEALSLIDTLQPDIIIADIVMPLMDGVDFSKIINEKYPDIQLIILSSYNDFNFVRTTLLNQAVDYILKPTLNPEDLLKALKKAVLRIPGMVLKQDNSVHTTTNLSRYLLGFESTLDTLSLKTSFPLDRYLLLGSNIKSNYRDNKRAFGEISQNTYLKLKENPSCHICSIDVGEEFLLYLVNYNTCNELSLFHHLEESIQSVSETFQNIFFLISPSFVHLEDIQSIYEEHLKGFTSSNFYMKGCHMAHSKSLIAKTDDAPKFNMKQYQKLLQLFQFNDAMELLSSYIEDSKEHQPEPIQLKTTADNAIYNLITTLEDCNFDVYQLKLEYVTKIYNSIYFEDFQEFYEETTGQINAILANGQNNINDQIIHKILLYIESNYTKQLDLSEVAERFNFSYHYLSTYFSSHYKQGFNDYLNRLRIEKAKELLVSNQNLPIAEVGCIAGYSDHSYFCRVFKKFTNYTPSKYKKIFCKE